MESMTKRSATKDELFLLKLYSLSTDDEECQSLHDPVYVASLIGVSPKSCKNMVNTLAQANFIKKFSDGLIRLTPHGRKLAVQLSYEIG